MCVCVCARVCVWVCTCGQMHVVIVHTVGGLKNSLKSLILLGKLKILGGCEALCVLRKQGFPFFCFMYRHGSRSSFMYILFYMCENTNMHISIYNWIEVHVKNSVNSPTIFFYLIYLAAPALSWQHAGSSFLTRDQTQVPCIGSVKS